MHRMSVDRPGRRASRRETMNGPLLISLLPPEPARDSATALSGAAPLAAVFLLIGLLLSLLLRPPER